MSDEKIAEQAPVAATDVTEQTPAGAPESTAEQKEDQASTHEASEQKVKPEEPANKVIKTFRATAQDISMMFTLQPENLTLCISIEGREHSVCKQFASKETAEAAYDIGKTLFRMMNFTVQEIKP